MLPKATRPWTREEAAHLVRRAGFGGSPVEIDRIHALGREAAVDSLLKPDKTDDAHPLPEWAKMENAMKEARERIEIVREARRSTQGMSEEEAEKMRRQKLQEIQRKARMQEIEGGQWWFRRILTTRAPLREKMVIFWHDHFATSAQKVKQPALLMKQNGLFREHALGDFRELTRAIVRDPAMLLYLDGQNSSKAKPNENFAREIMELFTLGEGNYTEDDIREAARAFTGYTLNRLTGDVTQVRRRWDDGNKKIFGKTGKFDGDDVVDLIFQQPAAASYVPAKLWSYFVEDEAPPAIVNELAKSFAASGFRIEPLLREIFLSAAFYDGTVMRNQIKSPIQFLVQMCRELEIHDLPLGYTQQCQQQLGQVLFMPPNVAGWDWGRAWINTNTLLSRYNIAGVITTGAVNAPGVENDSDEMMAAGEGAGNGRMLARMVQRRMQNWQGPDYETLAPRELREDPEKLVDALIARFFQADPGTKQRTTFIEYARSKKGVVFTNHEVAELCHLMMSTPHYQLA